MKSIQIGRVRIRFGRFLRGATCPMNVISKNFNLIPEFSIEENQHSSDLSPVGVGETLLASLLKLLEGKRRQ